MHGSCLSAGCCGMFSATIFLYIADDLFAVFRSSSVSSLYFVLLEWLTSIKVVHTDTWLLRKLSPLMLSNKMSKYMCYTSVLTFTSYQ